MRIKVQLFGYVREQAGKSVVEVAVSDKPTLNEVVEVLQGMIPVKEGLRFAINTEYAELHRVVKEGDTVSVIPPVQGG